MMPANPCFSETRLFQMRTVFPKGGLDMEVKVGEGGVDDRERKAGREAKTATCTSKPVVKLKPLGVGDFGFLHENTKVYIEYILEET